VETKKIIILIIFLFCSGNYLYAADSADSANTKELQVGIYAGYGFSPVISNAQGKHSGGGITPISIYPSGGSSNTLSDDATVEDIEIEQTWSAGVNTRYYLTGSFDIEMDLIYSKAKFPAQEVVLNGSTIYQPKSDLNFFTVSAGPGYRFAGEGIWQRINPYAAAELSVLLGYASDVNLMPYGNGGYSALNGIGFNVHLGSQFHINKIVLSIEYRYEFLSSEVDSFRSFTEGLSFTKSGSYILLGIDYSL
jgi:hypothetical protein